MHRGDTPKVFLSGSGGWQMTLRNFNYRLKVLFGWQLFSAKMFLNWWILLDKSSATNDCLDLAFVRSTRSFTSLPGGNKVDGLPPESSFGSKHNFSCSGMEFLETDKFIWDISIFYSYIWLLRICWRSFHWIWWSGCRERARRSFLSDGFLVAEMLRK